MRIAASATLLLLSSHQIHASETEDAETLTSNLVQWVRNSGGFVSDKIAFRHINDDATLPRGVFALHDIDENETLAIIPWDLIIKSPERAAGKVEDRWSDDDCGVIQETLKAMTASEDDMTPYGKYLLSQPLNYTVGFWTEPGQELFVKLTGGTLYKQDNVLPPTDIDDQLIWDFQKACDGNVTDPMTVQAAMLVRARSDFEYMVPIYDMFNHDNGKYNIQHKYNPYTSPLEETGYGVITTRKIKAGEELYNSYNLCGICDGYFDWFGTPEVFQHYGFVENYPQRWLFDLARVKVELFTQEDGQVEVKFLVPPSKKGIDLLSKELLRLNDFAKEYRHKSFAELGMRYLEWNSMWEYYDAIYAALTYITKSTEQFQLVDDVWALGDDWWVQEGTTKEDEDEHWVRRTSGNEVCLSENGSNSSISNSCE